jgi:hypothetical protein
MLEARNITAAMHVHVLCIPYSWLELVAGVAGVAGDTRNFVVIYLPQSKVPVYR